MKVTLGNKGQSLIEVLAALAVTVVVILAWVQVIVTSIRNTAFAKNQTLATKYAQEAIEKARQLRDENPDDFFAPDYCDRTDDPDEKGVFERVRDCTLSADERTMTVEVTVSWVDQSISHKSRLETILTKWK